MTIGPIGHEQRIRYWESYSLSRKGKPYERKPKAKQQREGVSSEAHTRQGSIRAKLGPDLQEEGGQ